MRHVGAGAEWALLGDKYKNMEPEAKWVYIWILAETGDGGILDLNDGGLAKLADKLNMSVQTINRTLYSIAKSKNPLVTRISPGVYKILSCEEAESAEYVDDGND